MFNSGILYIIAILLQFHLGSADQRFVPIVPEECQRLGYCNLPQPDYPAEHVEKLIKTLGLQNANQSVVDSIQPVRELDPKEVKLCEYEEKEFIPLVAQDANGTWNFILNSKHYRQTYRVQICNETGIPCSSVAHFFYGYNASCAQNYITRVMKAIDHKGNIIETERPMPSNCYCKVQQDISRNNQNARVQVKKDSRSQKPADVERLWSKILENKYH